MVEIKGIFDAATNEKREVGWQMAVCCTLGSDWSCDGYSPESALFDPYDGQESALIPEKYIGQACKKKGHLSRCTCDNRAFGRDRRSSEPKYQYL